MTSISATCMQELGKIELKDSSGGKFYHFTLQYIDGYNSAEWNSTTKFLVNKIVNIPTTTVLKLNVA